MNEADYIRGRRSAWASIMAEAARELGLSTEEGHMARMMAEREQAIAVLRRVCEEHGDNDWNENPHLVDIIDKHLARYLSEAVEDAVLAERKRCAGIAMAFPCSGRPGGTAADLCRIVAHGAGIAASIERDPDDEGPVIEPDHPDSVHNI